MKRDRGDEEQLRRVPAWSRAETLVLFAVVVLGAALRFAGLSHHLEHGGPEFDERQNFVAGVLEMWNRSTFDPTVYAGYPGLFNYLAFLPVGIGQRLAGEPGAYTAARAMVAAFGTLSIVLAHGVTRRYGGAVAGLFAAALLAVARIEVRSAHFVTADVLVGSATLGTLWLLARRGRPAAEIGAGVVCGLATATKYTGLLIVPAIATGLAVSGRLRRLPALTIAGALAFALAAPYAVTGTSTSGQGMALLTGAGPYYGVGGEGSRLLRGEGSLVGGAPRAIAQSLGPGGLALIAAALAISRRRRDLLPAASVVAAALLVMAPANLVNPRHVVPAVAASVCLAGAGFGAVLERLSAFRLRTAAALALVASVLVPQAVFSGQLVARFLRTPAVEQAARWLEANLGEPALVASSLAAIRLPDRFELRRVESLAEIPEAARAHYDALIACSRREAASVDELAVGVRFASEEGNAELDVTILQPARRPALSRRPPSRVAASGGAQPAAAAWDGDNASVSAQPTGRCWTEARWDTAVRIARVEVEVADLESWPQPLELLASPDGSRWEAVAAEPLRPTRPSRQRPGAPHGQAFVLTPAIEARGLRIERAEGRAWRLAEVRVFEERR